MAAERIGTWRDCADPKTRHLLLGGAAISASMVGLLARRGSWYGDDLDLLVDGTRGFSPGALLAPANDHVVPGLRAVFAVFAHAGFSYDFTAAWRAIVLFGAIVLMGLLIHRLTQSTTWTLLGAAMYALNPLSVPPFMQLSAAVNDLHAQFFALAFLHASISWFVDRRRLALLAAPLFLLLVLCFWLKAGLIVVTAAALLGTLPKDRDASTLTRVVGPWLAMIAVPILVVGAIIVGERRPDATVWPGSEVMLQLLANSFTQSVIQPLVGGPWTWVGAPYASASPSAVAVGLALMVFTALIVLCVWRARSALLLWVAVVVFWLATVATVGPARYHLFGDSLVRTYHYWSDLSIPLVLAVVMTIRGALKGLETRRLRTGCRALSVVAATWLVGALFSHAAFAGVWADNPARPYFATLAEELRKSPVPPNLWDTPLPSSISAPINVHRRLSDVLSMAGFDIRIQQPESDPMVVDDKGRIRPGILTAWATGDVPPDCRLRLLGKGSVTVPLSTRLPPANWYVQMAYLANPDANVTVHLEDSTSGASVELRDWHRPWPAGLLNVHLNDHDVQHPIPVDRVVVTSTDPLTNVCIGTTQVGLIEVAL